ncbi:MAG: hypothetical protein AAB316_21430 [Bacteroidota bacterium]
MEKKAGQLSYRRNWQWLWFFDLATIAVLCFFLWKSSWGKNDVFPVQAALFMVGYGMVRTAWLLAFLVIYIFKKNWRFVAITLIHGGAWFTTFYGSSLMVAVFGASVGGH